MSVIDIDFTLVIVSNTNMFRERKTRVMRIEVAVFGFKMHPMNMYLNSITLKINKLLLGIFIGIGSID